jgi:Spy/CpxP family protein refolding chaperone
MTSRVKGALLLIVAFLLGAAAGALGFGVYQVRIGGWRPPRGDRFQEFILRRLTRELELKAEQRQQVEAILRETGEEFARLREEVRPRYREIQTRSRGRIKAVLDAGQQAKFDALADEWERRAERRRARPEDGGRGTGDAEGKRDGR